MAKRRLHDSVYELQLGKKDKQDMPAQTLALGQEYLRKGWSIIPVRARDKVPQCDWRPFMAKRATPEELAEWLRRWPDMNLGIVTGAISGLVVVDLDGAAGLESGQKLGLLSSGTVWTGKGKHLYYKHPGEKVCNAVRKLPGVDIRGDGGFVLAPPSIHPNGRAYSWAGASSVNALPEFPASLFVPAQNVPRSTVLKPAGWIAEALEGLGDGNRNSTFASLVGKLHSQRWSASDIRSLLLPHAVRVQFPEVELDTVIRSITRYPVTVNGNRSPALSGGLVRQDPPKLSVRTFGTDWADYERRKSGEKSGELATGYPRFDALLNGGLIKERLLTVAARTGVGKTNWLLGVCRALCLRGKRVLYLSTELSYKKIWDRYIPLVGSEAEARKHTLIVSDEFIPDPEAIKDAILDHKPDVFIFDHIHNVSEENAEVGRYIKALAQYAKEFQIPGIVAAQLNKDAYWIDRETGKRVVPHLGMIKGASAIIQISGQVLILDDQDETPEQRDILGVLDKNSDGEKGLVQFVLKKHPYRMVEA